MPPEVGVTQMQVVLLVMLPLPWLLVLSKFAPASVLCGQDELHLGPTWCWMVFGSSCRLYQWSARSRLFKATSWNTAEPAETEISCNRNNQWTTEAAQSLLLQLSRRMARKLDAMRLQWPNHPSDNRVESRIIKLNLKWPGTPSQAFFEMAPTKIHYIA